VGGRGCSERCTGHVKHHHVAIYFISAAAALLADRVQLNAASDLPAARLLAHVSCGAGR
jgi:hypothetical protein